MHESASDIDFYSTYEKRIRTIAKAMWRSSTDAQRTDLEDFTQEALISGLRARRKFDPKRGLDEATFVVTSVRFGLRNVIRQLNPIGERPRRALRQALRAGHADATLEDIRATSPLVARALLLRYRSSVVFLDAPNPHHVEVFGRDAGPLVRFLRDASVADPATLVADRERDDAVNAAIALLPPREAIIIRAHYFREVSLRDLSIQLGITPQRVSQLHARALRRLRKNVRGFEPSTHREQYAA